MERTTHTNAKETTMSATDSFVIGFNYGTFNGVELTASEIAIQFPDVNADAFAQGNIDALHGDRFRVDSILQAKRIAALLA